MASKKAEGIMSMLGKTFVGRLFPEMDWEQLDGDRYQQVCNRLQAASEYGQATANYLQQSGVRLGYYAQENSGGGWTLLRNITLARGAALADAYTLSLIVHEIFHLKQSIFQRLSIYGELLAWQHQRKAYHELAGREIGDVGAEYAGKKAMWDQLSALSADSRADLATAQQLMSSIATGYRSDCLPLYPLFQEAGYFLRQGRIREIFSMIWNLLTCR